MFTIEQEISFSDGVTNPATVTKVQLMTLFSSDLYRSFAIGFGLGTFGVAVMFANELTAII